MGKDLRPIPLYGDKYLVAMDDGTIWRKGTVDSAGTYPAKAQFDLDGPWYSEVSTFMDRGRERVTLYRNGKRWSPYVSTVLARIRGED